MSNEVTISPGADVTWAQDVFGNHVATAVFAAKVRAMEIASVSTIRLDAAAWPVFPIAYSAQFYPFKYSDDERTDLGALATPQEAEADGRLLDWARSFVRGSSSDTLALLKDLSMGVATTILYQSREEEGTQSPVQTLDRGSGSCRDYAVLFVEAARALGLGARIVSGYLHNPDLSLTGSAESGSTHAWAEVFVPGAGWITFDPTNRSVGGFNLIPVAVGRHIRQVAPVSGSYFGAPDASAGMSVHVDVTEL
jgi:transglutaminase-like putative cysteine protease